ncbi:MAG: sigma 54-interacting transcriptional regulator [Xanthomonadales bacterium]|nr:sigma 54-interacting transcriptional regulator [Xanthomonadales bacterium]
MNLKAQGDAATDILARAPGLYSVVNARLDCLWVSDDLASLRADPGGSVLGFVSVDSIERVRSALTSVCEDGGSVTDLPIHLSGSGGSTTALMQAWAIDDSRDQMGIAFIPLRNGWDGELDSAFIEAAETRDHILNAAGDAIYGIGLDGTATFVNKAAVDLLGWRHEDIIGIGVHEVHHHSHADGTPYPREDCPIYAAIRDGQVHRVDEEVFWTSEGEAVPVEYTSTPIIVDNEIKGAVVVFRSIAERLAIEAHRDAAFAEVDNLRNMLETLLDSAGEGIYGLSSDGEATFINKTAEKLLGWKQSDVVGRSIHEVHHHSHPDGSPYPREECPIYAAVKDGAVHRVDSEVFWTRDGKAIPVEYTSTPIMRDGRPDGAVVVFRDISARKKLEQERDQAFGRVQDLNRQLEQEREYLREEVDHAIDFGEIVGESDSLKHTLAQIEAVATTPVNVLVHGESGVGKEMIARAIHARSDRADKALVRVNCASIPEHLFESEFFGHVKGAFTGAHRDRVGRMQLANGGTLFLDEVGEIPLPLQSKLLRAIQEGQFEPVGEDQTQTADVRIVAATNRILKEEVKAGRFREDLFYRLSVFPIEVAPLRERPADILPLALHFVDIICANLGKDRLTISQRDAEVLQQQDWPGNVRELKNFIERAAILSKGNRLRVDLAHAGDGGPPASSVAPVLESDEYITDAEFRDLEKRNIRAALEASNWRVSGDGGAAALLEVKPSTLAYRIKALGIKKID